ncbi:MAG: archaeal proteasome endopeptidase complex subunit beta [Nanoarchaeota archaeon]|nr:archaeal proteasome endopeptidase complex subunit beta [Nanoarchaeota archaeon]MBU1135556.1 archaeal proteasome endopeptidase complex subunit beta [Nanoarchaeota archaeon]MBU2520379.1 archaeal proteasome endopeptidase complex subunit beta [Nanoarchaeota archaeon]
MNDKIEKLKTGTTTVGVMCKDAVVLGAERKATMGYLVADKNAQKILQLDDHIAMTIAGMQGDAQALGRYIKAEYKLFELQEGKKISLTAAANLMSNILYSRRFYPYYVQLIIGGYDKEPKLFIFDPTGAISDEKEYFSTGSGSPFALGVLEREFKKDMTVEDAKNMVANAIHSATKRDIASGGSGINLVVIDSKGYKKIPDEEVKKLIKN